MARYIISLTRHPFHAYKLGKQILTTTTKRRPTNYYFRIESGFNKVYNHSKPVENLKSIGLHENVKRKGYLLEEKYFPENR